MSTIVIEPKPTEQEFDVAKHMADRNARDAARAAGKELPKVEPKVEEPKPAVADADKSAKPTGDQRKLFRTLRENGEMRERTRVLEERLAALEGKKTADEPKPAADKEPKRENYSTDQEFNEARAEWKGEQAASKVIQAKEQETAQTVEIQRIAASFEAQMKIAGDVSKGGYADWSELVASSPAAKIDIYAEMPEIYMAFMGSEYAKDVMHEWLAQPDTLKKLIALYKADPGAALRSFNRFEGKVGKDVEAEKPEEKESVKVVAEEKPKPRPTRSVQAPSGEAPPAEPEIGSAAWMEKRNSQKRQRGY